MTITEAYIVQTDDPGMIALAQSLAKQSGEIPEKPKRVYGKKVKVELHPDEGLQ